MGGFWTDFGRLWTAAYHTGPRDIGQFWTAFDGLDKNTHINTQANTHVGECWLESWYESYAGNLRNLRNPLTLLTFLTGWVYKVCKVSRPFADPMVASSSPA